MRIEKNIKVRRCKSACRTYSHWKRPLTLVEYFDKGFERIFCAWREIAVPSRELEPVLEFLKRKS